MQSERWCGLGGLCQLMEIICLYSVLFTYGAAAAVESVLVPHQQWISV